MVQPTGKEIENESQFRVYSLYSVAQMPKLQ